MGDWRRARDWELLNNVSDIDDTSYDLLGRDIWFGNGEKADLVKYRRENHQMEVYGFYEDSEGENLEGEELVDSLRTIGRFLSREGFKYRVSTKRTDNIRDVQATDLEGHYFFSRDADRRNVAAEIEDLLGHEDGFDSLEPLRCKE